LNKVPIPGTKEKNMGYPYYVVRMGRIPGIVTTWKDCLERVNGFKGASYRGFDNLRLANTWLETGTLAGLWPQSGLACDGGCKGNPGRMVYKVALLPTGEIIFDNQEGGDGTNNKAEFRALEKAVELAHMGQEIYCDSLIALSWATPNHTGHIPRAWADKVITMIHEKELVIKKWDKQSYGEMPCDCK
jgi:ribonuclease HI